MLELSPLVIFTNDPATPISARPAISVVAPWVNLSKAEIAMISQPNF
jgi:hypothetical protein